MSTPPVPHFIIPEDVRQCIDGKALFYPCSGDDWQVPVMLFSPVITDFWFVDLAYFTLQDQAADRVSPWLGTWPDYKLQDDIQVTGPACAQSTKIIDPDTGERIPWMEPCVRTERYLHLPSDREIRIYRRRGYGPSAMRKHIDIDEMGVFFYRGDSQGEGGSGTWWLTTSRKRPGLFDQALARLTDGGLVVTDGSNCMRPYRRLAAFHSKSIGSDAVSLARAFHDGRGHRFECIGYAGERYGPTLVWQVWKE